MVGLKVIFKARSNPASSKELRKVRLSVLSNYYPVSLALALTWVFTYLLGASDIHPERPVVTPIEEPKPSTPPAEALASPAPYLNTLIFISIIAVAGVVLIYLARRRPGLFKALITVMIWLVSLSITVLYLVTAAVVTQPLIAALWLPIGIGVATIVTFLLVRGGGLGAASAAAFIASGSGGVIGISIPYWTFLILVAGISVYDVVAVFRGHLSTLSREDAPQLRGLAVEVGDVMLGLGDLFFYSLTLSAILWNLGAASAIAATIMLFIGYTLVLALLRKRRLLPGLPIPLLTALAAALTVAYIV